MIEPVATVTGDIDALTLCSHSPNLGDTRSIASHPASTTHSQLDEREQAAASS